MPNVEFQIWRISWDNVAHGARMYSMSSFQTAFWYKFILLIYRYLRLVMYIVGEKKLTSLFMIVTEIYHRQEGESKQ